VQLTRFHSFFHPLTDGVTVHPHFPLRHIVEMLPTIKQGIRAVIPIMLDSAMRKRPYSVATLVDASLGDAEVVALSQQ
jgi:hypothetical protein